MEHTLGVMKNISISKFIQTVLILVLMEHTLGVE